MHATFRFGNQSCSAACRIPHTAYPKPKSSNQNQISSFSRRFKFTCHSHSVTPSSKRTSRRCRAPTWLCHVQPQAHTIVFSIVEPRNHMSSRSRTLPRSWLWLTDDWQQRLSLVWQHSRSQRFPETNSQSVRVDDRTISIKRMTAQGPRLKQSLLSFMIMTYDLRLFKDYLWLWIIELWFMTMSETMIISTCWQCWHDSGLWRFT